MTKKYFGVIFFVALACASSGCATRNLTPGEINLAREFFGGSINYGDILIGKKIPGQFSNEFGATTLDSKIFYREDIYSDDISKSIYVDDYWLFIHELTHVWQFQTKQIGGDGREYSWGLASAEHVKYGDHVYDYKISDFNCLGKFRYEQQGKIMQDYVLIKIMNEEGGANKKMYESVIYGECGIKIGTNLPLNLINRIK